MPLDDAQIQWLYEFTGGAVQRPPRLLPAPGHVVELLAEEMRIRQQKERVDEQALKEVELAKSTSVVEQSKEQVRQATGGTVQMRDQKSGKVTRQEMNPRKQEKGVEAAEFGNVVVPDREQDKGAFGERMGKAGLAYAVVLKQAERLGRIKVERSYIDEKENLVATKLEPLFTEQEITREFVTPLVRERAIADTFLPGKFSATQQMIDGSNEYYIKECRDKGKEVGYGIAGISKATLTLATTITTTVLGGLATVDHSMVQGLSGSDTLSKAQSAMATDIVTGTAALLTATIDGIDGAVDYAESGDFQVSGYKGVMNNIALGIGKIVGAATGDMNTGLVVSDSLSGAVALTALIPEFTNWRKKGGEPPIAALIEGLGGAIGSSFSAVSDKTSDSATSTIWAQAGVSVGAVFTTVAKAKEKKLVESIKKGDWGAVFEVIETAGAQAAKSVPVAVKFAADYNAISEPNDKEKLFQEQQKQFKQITDLATATDKTTDSLTTLTNEAMAKAAEGLGLKGPVPSNKEQLLKQIEAKFEEEKKKKEKEAEEAEAKEIASIQANFDKERKEYQDSLNCLGSSDPSTAEHKQIAKLIAQIEKDRKIWDAFNALFGGGVGIATASTTMIAHAAQEIAPPLKAAGQLMKFVANLKAASDRLLAWLDWREGRKDAVSAVSPYATSIDNFVQNQGAQFTYYTAQAASAAIQALLACGEMSPYAPAFKVAGGAVAAATAAGDVIYKIYKQAALRRAWAETKEALDPKNKGNRKMALLVRAINPTLAKYTIAYGALIEKSPIAITACNRVGLDRETLTRAGDKVADVKKYFETLYPDDNKVVGLLDAEVGKTKVPAPALTTKAWTLTHHLWTEKEKLITPNPPAIVANLAIAEKMLARDRATLQPVEFERLIAVLGRLKDGFDNFEIQTSGEGTIKGAEDIVETYADLAEATAQSLRLDMEVKLEAAASVVQVGQQAAS